MSKDILLILFVLISVQTAYSVSNAADKMVQKYNSVPLVKVAH
jgi:hypothetical protein